MATSPRLALDIVRDPVTTPQNLLEECNYTTEVKVVPHCCNPTALETRAVKQPQANKSYRPRIWEGEIFTGKQMKCNISKIFQSHFRKTNLIYFLHYRGSEIK